MHAADLFEQGIGHGNLTSLTHAVHRYCTRDGCTMLCSRCAAFRAEKPLCHNETFSLDELSIKTEHERGFFRESVEKERAVVGKAQPTSVKEWAPTVMQVSRIFQV